MSVTLDSRPFDNINTHRVVFGTFVLGSYLTGGLSLTAAELKTLGEIEKILFEPASNGTPVILLLKYDYVNQKVLSFDLAGNQSSNAADLSAYTAGFVAFGK